MTTEEIIDLALRANEATNARLAAEKKEGALKASLKEELRKMNGKSVSGLDADGVVVVASLKDVTTNVVDVAKLAPLLSLEQLTACVTVTQVAASKFLSKEAVTACLVAGPSRETLSITVSKK